MLKIVWRNCIGYIVESSISYRVYFTYQGCIVQCFHLSPEGLDKAKGVLIAAEERMNEELRREEDRHGYV